MVANALGAIAVAEMRSAVGLVRTQLFMAVAIATGLGIYAAQAVFHRILWASSHLVTPPRFLIDTIGTVVLAILTVGTVALAFDHRVRDRHDRIAEAVDTRPPSNLALVAGRLIGIVGVVWLTAVVLALIIQAWGFVAPIFRWPVGEGMEPVSLVMFLVLDALPTLVFWCALTLMLAAVLRFRLAVLVVALSLIGAHVWIAANVPVFLHDAVVANLAATQLPSDAAPVLPDGADLLQRVALLAIAAGFLLVAAELHPRRDGGATTPRVLGGIGFVAIGVLLIAELIVQSFAGRDGKTAWVAAHEAHRDAPRLDLESVGGVIRIEPGHRLTIDVELALANPHDRALQDIVFSLNPGLVVEEIRVDGVAASYRHEMGVLAIEPPAPLAADGVIGIGVLAKGVPDPRFAYLDGAIDNSAAPTREARVNTLGTVASIFQHDFVALMPGVRWLPSPGSILGDGDPDQRPRDFFFLDIDVEVPGGWLIAGPGRREAISAGRFRFQPQAVVDEVGLFASRLERRAMLANGIEFELLVRPGHLDNVRLFEDAGTPLGGLLGDWIHEPALPGFVASPLRVVRLTDTREGAPRYQTLVHVHNGEPVGGLLRVRYIVRAGTSSTGARAHWSRPIRVDGHASVEIGMVVPGAPQAGWVEPYLSLNQGRLALPPPRFDRRTRSPADPLTGTRASDWRPFPDGEIVVDDLDPGFVVAEDHGATTKRGASAIAGEQDGGLPEYTMFAGLPQDWTRLPIGSAWGRYRHTVAVTETAGRAGEVVFRAKLPSAGRWRVDYHLPLRGARRAAAQRNDVAASRRELAVRDGAPRFLTQPGGVYPIKVITDNQGIPVDFDASNGTEGWNPIGGIELDAPGEVHVVVSLAETNAQATPVVIADAVRWLKLPDLRRPVRNGRP